MSSDLSSTESQRISREDGVKVLREAREMVVSRLTDTFRSSLDKLEEQLYELAEKAIDRETQNGYLDARAEAKARRAELEKTFRDQFAKLFDDRLHGEDAPKKPSGLADLELSLVDEADLESSIAVKEFARRLSDMSEAELGPLAQRFGLLMRREGLESTDIPASPDAIADSLVKTLAKLDAKPKLRIALLRLIEQMIAQDVRKIYGDMNAHFISHQVLPQIRPAFRRSTPGGPGAARPAAGVPDPRQAAADLAQTAAMPPVAESDVYAQLAAMLAPPGMAGMPGMGAIPGMAPMGMPGEGLPGGPMGAPGLGMGPLGVPGMSLPAGTPVQGIPGLVMPSGGFMGALTGLQQGGLRDFWNSAGLDLAGWNSVQLAAPPEELAGAQPNWAAADYVNLVRQIRTSPVGSQVNQADGVTIDIVALLFDYIFEDKEIPPPVKHVVSRLQIPVLKVALVDKTFFSNKTHPVRLFLDQLAQASVGCPPDVSRDDPLFRCIESTVERIVTEFETDVTLFTRELHGLDRFLADYRESAVAMEEKTIAVAEAREHDEAARYAIEVEVSARASSPDVPIVTQALISETLPPLLEAAQVNGGSTGEAWQAALKLMDDLLWSVAPKPTPEARKELLSMLPSLLRRLREAMHDAKLDEAKAEAYLRSLAPMHAAAVKAEHVAPPQAVTSTAPVEVDVSAEPELTHKRIETEDGIAIEEIRLVKQARELRAAIDQYDLYDAEVKRLARGSWMEFRRSDGNFVRAKLTFMNADYGVYVFTNPQLDNALSVSREALVLQLKTGDARMVVEKSLLDRALDGLFGKLRGVPATPQPAMAT